MGNFSLPTTNSQRILIIFSIAVIFVTSMYYWNSSPELMEVRPPRHLMAQKRYSKSYRNSNITDVAIIETPPSNGSSDPSLILKKPWFGMHIPKTGGTSLGAIFAANCEPKKFHQTWFHPTAAQIAKENMTKKDVIFGHFRYGLHEAFNVSTYSYITVFRDPIDRVVSHYHYHRTIKKDPRTEMARTLNLSNWLTTSLDAINVHTQFIAGVKRVPTQEDFELAKRNLRSMGMVGLTERFDETVVLFKYYLNFTKLTYTKRKVNYQRPDVEKLDETMLEQIRAVNLMDLELYEIAKEMFEDQIKRVGVEEFELVLDEFRKLNMNKNKSMPKILN